MQPSSVFYEYRVVVDTGKMLGSQTTGDVDIQLMGIKDKQVILYLQHGWKVSSRTELSGLIAG